MDRVLEPELMDEETQAEAYAEADFTEPHERCANQFVAWWRAHGGPRKACVLDLGCGPADVTVRIARRCPEVTFIGLDGSEAMLGHGRSRVAAGGLASRISLYQALLPHDPPPPGAIDVVFSNSLLHHLHDPHALWSYVARHAPSALVFVMDLMRPATIADVDRLVEEHARGEPEVLRRDFRASLCAAFTTTEVRAQLSRAGLALEVEAVGDRHLVVCTPGRTPPRDAG
jgi:SAM-dependent methyltransferase